MSETSDLPRVEMYTDGSTPKGNPGPGGYAAIWWKDGVRDQTSGGYGRTTNNRMEMLAAIEGLRALENPCVVELFSDSQYLVRGMNKGWLKKWKRNGWRARGGTPVKNQDLWRRLEAAAEPHQVRFSWIQGHNGNPHNEAADQLASAAALSDTCRRDWGYQEPADLEQMQRISNFLQRNRR